MDIAWAICFVVAIISFTIGVWVGEDKETRKHRPSTGRVLPLGPHPNPPPKKKRPSSRQGGSDELS